MTAPEKVWFTKVGNDIVPNSKKRLDDDTEYTRSDLIPAMLAEARAEGREQGLREARDTAWNDAIEAAAKYHDKFLMTKTSVDVEAVVASTEAIRALRKGGPA